MEKIISTDKILHFLAGALITALVALFAPSVEGGAIFFAVLAGLSKEIYDRATDGLFDWFDLLATFVGGLFVQILIWGGL